MLKLKLDLQFAANIIVQPYGFTYGERTEHRTKTRKDDDPTFTVTYKNVRPICAEGLKRCFGSFVSTTTLGKQWKMQWNLASRTRPIVCLSINCSNN